MADKARAMPLNLQVMTLLGLLAAGIGLPLIVRPDRTRALIGLKNTPQMAYILRITGTMVTALGPVLIVFAVTFWKAGA